jgi:hypothetical protein
MQVQLQGIKTDLFAIERYVDEIITQIKGKHFFFSHSD